LIQVVYGKKGTGKTKHIIDMANASIKEATGSIVFIHVNKDYMYELDRGVRFIDSTEYRVKGPKMLSGFIAGLAAQDYDLEYIFVDGFMKMIGEHSLESLESLFLALDSFASDFGITIVISVSDPSENAPEFLKPYITWHGNC